MSDRESCLAWMKRVRNHPRVLQLRKEYEERAKKVETADKATQTEPTKTPDSTPNKKLSWAEQVEREYGDVEEDWDCGCVPLYQKNTEPEDWDAEIEFDALCRKNAK